MGKWYHGTAACFEQQIRQHGIRPSRERGRVYLTPIEDRAWTYATAWAVGLHNAGETEAPVGLVVTVDGFPEEQDFWQEQSVDFAVDGDVKPGLVVKIETRDFSGLPADVRLAHLAQFVGVVCWPGDPYAGTEGQRFQTALDAATAVIKAHKGSVDLTKVPVI